MGEWMDVRAYIYLSIGIVIFVYLSIDHTNDL